MKYLKLLISFSLLSLIISCSVNPVTGERDFVLMSEDAESKLRLLNGDYPDGNLDVGTWIKIVE